MTLTRRELLRLGVVGGSALLLSGLLEACRGPGQPVASGPAGSLGELLAARGRAGAASGLDVITVGTDLLASVDNNVVFFLQHGTTRLFGSHTQVWLTPTIENAARIAPTGPLPAPWFPYSHPEGPAPLPQGLNAFDFNFSQPGLWTLVAETTSGPHLIGSTVIANDGQGIKPLAQAKVKVPGTPAIASLTPTVADPQGVNPICTRLPPCDMHQISLKEALGNAKPTAFIVATPKFCQSRNCGPSLEELIAVEGAVHGAANFVHAEVYPNGDPKTIEQMIPTPTFTAWGLQSEPWLFLIDRRGIISKRFEGGFTAGQVQAALTPLLA